MLKHVVHVSKIQKFWLCHEREKGKQAENPVQRPAGFEPSNKTAPGTDSIISIM
jgi:hypothetical protein